MAELRDSPHPDIAPELEREPGTDPAIRVVRSSMRRELNWQGAKLTVATVVVAIGTAFGAYRVVLSEAAAQTENRTQVQAEKHDALKARVETLEGRFDRFESRSDKQMNLALDALRVPQSARPPPLDGGQ